jgi:hypothetical protein
VGGNELAVPEYTDSDRLGRPSVHLRQNIHRGRY